MKLLVIADKKPGIDIVSTVASENIDAIITLGDLVLEDILQLRDIDSTPKIGVYGNHDSGTYMPSLGILDIHLKTWDFQGLRFGGFQGCVRYKENPDAIMYTQAEANELLEGFPPVDVFVSHCPPRGINDEEEISHQGFDALRKYLDTNHPALWLHGHTYPTDETIVRQYSNTRIEYVFRYKIITV